MRLWVLNGRKIFIFLLFLFYPLAIRWSADRFGCKSWSDIFPSVSIISGNIEPDFYLLNERNVAFPFGHFIHHLDTDLNKKMLNE